MSHDRTKSDEDAVRVEDPGDEVPLHKQKRVWFGVGGVAVIGALVALIVILTDEDNQTPTPPAPTPPPTSLVAFYNETNGDEWDTNTKWLSDAPVCEWYGLGCNSDDEVVAMYMGGNNLKGE